VEVGTTDDAESISGTAIRMRDLTKAFGHTQALAGLTLDVPRGEIFGFLGPNGAGKTTAVKLLLGLLRPTSGKAWVLGAPAGDLNARRRIGYLPELFRYQSWLHAHEVMELHCELARIPRRRWKDEIELALATVDLGERAKDRVGTFSKGMQQRLGLGVALLGRPELVFLDEPTSALDPVGRHDVRQIIRDLKKGGTAVFLNSHLLSEVEQVCDRVAVVDHGHVITSGRLEDVLGAAKAIRIHATGVNSETRKSLAQFGKVDREGDVMTIQGIDEAATPALIATLVAAGASIYAVEPRHQSLEDRFLELLSGD
jgi:ABC-2 type transport system ATP-binding protein